MNRINPKKILNSKWTAVVPMMKEKHFLVSELKLDEEGEVTYCQLEAVISHRVEQIDWNILKDSNNWLQG